MFVLNSYSVRILIPGDKMSYQIRYGRAAKPRIPVWSRLRLPLLLFVSFLLFLIHVETLWPEGSAGLHKIRFFNQEVLPVSALNELSGALHDGEGLISALLQFCETLIS